MDDAARQLDEEAKRKALVWLGIKVGISFVLPPLAALIAYLFFI